MTCGTAGCGWIIICNNTFRLNGDKIDFQHKEDAEKWMTVTLDCSEAHVFEKHSLAAVDRWDPELVWSVVDWTVPVVQLVRLFVRLAFGSAVRLVTPCEYKMQKDEFTTFQQEKVDILGNHNQSTHLHFSTCCVNTSL